MVITNSIRMDLKHRGIAPLIHAVQNETSTRAIELTLTSGGEAWEIPAGVVAAIRFRKADGTSGLYDTLSDGTSACSIFGSTVTATLAPQVLTAAGMAVLQIVLINGDAVLCSFGIGIQVEADASNGPFASQDYINLTKLIKEQVEEYLEENPTGGGGGSVTSGADGYSILPFMYSSGGALSPTWPLSDILAPDTYSNKAGDLVLSADGYLYQINSIDEQAQTAALTLLGDLNGLDGKTGYSTLPFSGNVYGSTIVVAEVTKPDGYTLKKGDMLLGLDGSLYRVTTEVYTDTPGEVADVTLLGSFMGATGPQGPAGSDGASVSVSISRSGKATTIEFTNAETGEILNRTTFYDGEDGQDGSDGVGIASIEQTTTSTADGGSNVFTVVLTNGEKATFTVKNGSKGSAGADGSNGKDGADGNGIKSAVLNADYTLTLTFDDGTSYTTPSIRGTAGADGYTPVKGVDYYTEEDKAEMVEEVRAAMEGVPDYWVSALETGADNIRQAMETAGRNKAAFLFYSDAHWNSGAKISPVLLNYLYKHTAVNKAIFGGDIVQNEPTADTLENRSIMEYLWDWRRQIRDLKHYSVVGNHDDGNATNNIFSYDYVYSYLFAPEENSEIVHGGDTYYYFDDAREKTRYLCLDTAYEGLTSLSTAQTAFINESLIGTPTDWRIIVVAHIWYMPDYDQYDVRPIPLTGLSSTAEQLVTILDNYNSRSGDFADCGATVKLCIGGHVHRDYVDKTPGGIPIVLVETDSWNIRGEFSYEAGTDTEAAVSCVVVNYEANKASVIRVGRGNSFEIDLTTGESTETPDDGEDTPTYTNVLDTAGYTEGYRLSGGSGTEKVNANTDLTGYIAVNEGDTIYMKNVTAPYTDSSSYYDFAGYYGSDKTFITAYYINLCDGLVYDADGNITAFKIPIHSDSEICYVRICAQNIDGASIITVNEPIE